MSEMQNYNISLEVETRNVHSSVLPGELLNNDVPAFLTTKDACQTLVITHHPQVQRRLFLSKSNPPGIEIGTPGAMLPAWLTAQSTHVRPEKLRSAPAKSKAK
jgi:hypothetical protein